MTCNVLGTVNRNPLESHAEPENVWKMLEFSHHKNDRNIVQQVEAVIFRMWQVDESVVLWS